MLRFNGALLGSVSADSFGNFGAFIFTVPSGTAAAQYTVSAVGSVSGRAVSSTLSVTATQPSVTAAISVSPSTAVRGSTVSVAGTGFQPGETISIFFGSGVVAGATADGSGTFVNRTFVVPANTSAGTYTVQALGSTGRIVSTQLTVTNPPAVVVASLNLNPSQTAPRGTVHFNGQGYNAGEYVQISVNGQPLGYVIASAGGGVSGSFLAPRLTALLPFRQPVPAAGTLPVLGFA